MINLITSLQRRVPYLIQTIVLIWQALRWMLILWLLIIIGQGLIPGLVTYLMKLLVDRLVLLFNDWTPEHLNSAATVVGYLVLGVAFNTLLRSASTALRALRQEQVSDYISELIHKQAARLDMSFFESKEYYDSLHRAHTQARSRPLDLIDSLANLLRMSVSLISFVVILASTSFLLPMVLALSALPLLYVITRQNRRMHQWDVDNTPNQRRVQYYDSIIISRESAAELRVYGQESHFQRAYNVLREQLRTERVQLVQQQQAALSVVSWLIYAVLGSAMAYTMWQAIQSGAVSAGDIVLLYQSLFSAQSFFSEMQAELGRVYQYSLYLEHLFLFLGYEPRVKDAASPLPLPERISSSIEFEAVRFQYPGSERWSLNGLNITIPAGKIVAIVGENGAGKSTLIKLLCRLYDPTEGHVLIDGIDIRTTRLEELRNRIAVLFQQPVYYDESAANNIALGALQKPLSPAAIQSAAAASGADQVIARLPQGYDTMLGKRFGDEDLSVGQWKRIALARALVRPADLLILDEPTSAMDPWAESEWLAHLKAIAAERTTIIVTHRFTTARQADLIYVMAEGKVVESGTHNELLLLNQRYAESWKRQVEDSVVPASEA